MSMWAKFDVFRRGLEQGVAYVYLGGDMEMRAKVRALRIFGMGLEIGWGVDVFGDLEYLGSSDTKREGMLMCLGVWGA